MKNSDSNFSVGKETKHLKPDYFLFLSIETTHIIIGFRRKNYTAADNDSSY